jgi:Ni,Fe-hydrogenase III large subunit/Ni,Fe-hydrogenase III component G
MTENLLIRRQIDMDGLAAAAAALLADGHRLALVAAHEDLEAFRVVYLFTGAGDRRVELVLRTDRDAPCVPSLASLSLPASRFEREMRDLHGVVPLDHPLPRRLVRHQHWPQGWYPMRSGAGPAPPFPEPAANFPFLRVEGPGVYEIPVGPVHAGLIEPGHFRFSVVGETILKLKARLWFVHKGIEKLAEGRPPEAVLPLAERVSGDSSLAHALAFCLAVEDAYGWTPPPGLATVRAVLLEMERLYNHVGDLGALCNDVGYGIANSHFLRVREHLLRLNADVTGHRLLRDAVRPAGGPALRGLPSARALTVLAADVARTAEIALANSIVRERMTGTAVLGAEQIRDTGALGYVARASGVDIDARRDHPFCDGTADVVSARREEGDVLARFRVRADEIQASVGLLGQLLGAAPLGPACAPVPASGADAAFGGLRVGSRDGASGVGLVEGWRGTVVHRVEIAADGTLTRWKVVDPSFLTWPALPVALADTIVGDFPLVNKSFNMSYAGNDL